MKTSSFVFTVVMSLALSSFGQVCIHNGIHPIPMNTHEQIVQRVRNDFPPLPPLPYIPPKVVPTENEIVQNRTKEASTTYQMDGELVNSYILGDRMVLIFKRRYEYSVVSIRYQANETKVDIKNFIKELPEEKAKPIIVKPLEKE